MKQWIIDLIRDGYDKAPDHYRMGDTWDDGAERIADQIIERAAHTQIADAGRALASEIAKNISEREHDYEREDELRALADKIGAWTPSSGVLVFIARERRLIEDALRVAAALVHVAKKT